MEVQLCFESESESHSVMSSSLQPHGLNSRWNSPGQNTGVGSHSFLQGIFPTQGSNPDLPPLQADSSPAKPPGKPKNTGMGSLSLLQRIFPTQESNGGSPALQADSLPTELSGKPSHSYASRDMDLKGGRSSALRETN